jgi:hypothetical protein
MAEEIISQSGRSQMIAYQPARKQIPPYQVS